jgi:hypothetical protein
VITVESRKNAKSLVRVRIPLGSPPFQWRFQARLKRQQGGRLPLPLESQLFRLLVKTAARTGSPSEPQLIPSQTLLKRCRSRSSMRFNALERAFCKCSWVTSFPASRNFAASPGFARHISSGVGQGELRFPCNEAATKLLRMKDEARRRGSCKSAGFLPDLMFGSLAIVDRF